MFKDENDLRKQIIQDYESTGPEGQRSFEKVVSNPKYKGMPRGTACTIYNKGDGQGPIPKKWKIIYRLHTYEPMPVCLSCGKPHPRKTCPEKEKGKPRKRTNVNLVNPVSAKDTIINSPHTDLIYIQWLVDELTNYLIMVN